MSVHRSVVVLVDHLRLRFRGHGKLFVALNQISLFRLDISQVGGNHFGLMGLELSFSVFVLVELSVSDLVCMVLRF